MIELKDLKEELFLLLLKGELDLNSVWTLTFPIIDASGEGKKWVVGGVSRERFAEG